MGIYDSKYRVRGVTDANDKNDSSIESPLIYYLHSNFGFNCDIIGLDIEYKYKTATKDSTKIVNNNNNIFTDWNRINTIERERYLKFDNITKFSVENPSLNEIFISIVGDSYDK